MDLKRRSFLRGLFSAAGMASAATAHAQHVHEPAPAKPVAAPASRAPVAAPGGTRVPVVTPDVPDMPWRLENGVKVFDLTVGARPHRVHSWTRRRRLGLQRQCPGSDHSGQRRRSRAARSSSNHLPEPFSMHWHGLEIPYDMDGMPGISQDPIPPGGTFAYEFTLKQNGTFFYHSHMAMQEMMGLIGLFIIHPRTAHTRRASIATSASSCRSGRSCRTTPSPTRWRWSSTG